MDEATLFDIINNMEEKLDNLTKEDIKEIQKDARGLIQNILVKEYLPKIIEKHEDKLKDQNEIAPLLNEIAMVTKNKVVGARMKGMDIEEETVDLVDKLTEMATYFYIQGIKDKK